MKRTIELVGIFILMTLALVNCKKDKLSEYENGTEITVSMGDMPVVETRSEASVNERFISDAYILVFGTDGKYKAGEAISVSHITNNGQQKPSLSTQLVLEDGDKIVVLCNTGVTSLPSFVVGTSTTADINSKFLSGGWNLNQDGSASGKGMPMSGNVVWNNTTKPEVQMYRSVAKIQLVLAIPSGADLSHSFSTDVDAVKWGMYNVVKEGNVYSVNGAMSTPASSAFANSTALTQRVVGATAAALNQLTYYMPEYPNATIAQNTAVGASVFSADRTCLIVQTTAGYYRIDLATGNEMDETKAFLDIKRNYHYQVKITKVRSNGYLSIAEALQNPASNLEYEVSITGDNDNSTTTNGQYAVVSDRTHSCVVGSVSTAEVLLKFRCERNNVANATTRKVRLVKADKETTVPVGQLQLRKSDGSIISGNVFDPFPTSAESDFYTLKYTSYDIDFMPSEEVYVEITYGNIRHYVPVNAFSFKVTAPQSYTYIGGTKQYSVVSYQKTDPITPLAWTATEYSTDGGATWTSQPSWITAFTESGAGGNSANYNATLTPQIGINSHDAVLKAATPVSGTYNLANSTGGVANQYTANCYIVNAPGNYSLPLVYGSSIYEGNIDATTYTTNHTGDHILSQFIKHDGTAITSPYITGASNATLIWQDEPNLVTNIALSGDMLTFSVTRDHIAQGNAVIAVRNAANQVLWSWHIWVTDYKASDPLISFTNNYSELSDFMPVNIGWCDGKTFSARSVKVRFTQAETGLQQIIDLNQLSGSMLGNSPYYQWGRKDPFVAGLSGDITKPWYDANGNMHTEDPASASWPVSYVTTESEAKAVIANGILNPGTFNKNEFSDSYYCNLWSTSLTTTELNDFAIYKTVYDPSPASFSLPTSRAFTGFTTTGTQAYSSTQINGTWDGDTESWNFTQGENVLNFPALGNRRQQFCELTGVSNEGNYWTSGASKDLNDHHSNGWHLYFYSSGVVPDMTTGKSLGCSVRAVYYSPLNPVIGGK